MERRRVDVKVQGLAQRRIDVARDGRPKQSILLPYDGAQTRIPTSQRLFFQSGDNMS